MKKLFDVQVDRKNSSVIKWDFQSDKNSLPFWIADSDYPTAPCVSKELEDVAKIKAYGYNEIPDEFYQSVSNWYLKRYNSKVEKDWIVPATGVVLEIRILLDAITKENDGIILQTPVYHAFHHLINGMNRKIIENKLIRKNNHYSMDLENLEVLFKEGYKVMILCSPHNPVGRIWDKNEIENVINLAKKYNVFVIIDEIHSDLNISNKKFVSGINFENIYNSIAVCNAPSKAFNLAGLGVSYIIIPNQKIRELYQNQVKREFLNSPTVFGYRAMISAYNDGDKWIDAQNEYLLSNYNYLKEYLNKELEDVIISNMEGTYLVWLDFSYTNLKTNELLKRCNESGLTVSGGVDFCKDYESFIRFNIACPLSQLKEGLERLVKAFK